VQSSYYSQMHVGMAATPYPPGIGLWYSTPAQGQCLHGAALDGTKLSVPSVSRCVLFMNFRYTVRSIRLQNMRVYWRQDRATISYGSHFVEQGFKKVAGKETNGQNVVPQQVLVANGEAFIRAFEELNIANRCCGC
jgi:hypothetical protein